MANIRPLSPALQKTACEELNEVPERLAQDIAIIREWINQAKHIKSRTDDQFIVAFLRGCKFSIEKTKKKIEMFYTARTLSPEFFANRNLDDKTLVEIIDHGFILPLPVDESKTDPRIIFTRMGHYDPLKFSFLDVMKVTYMMSDRSLLTSDIIVIVGNINVVDLRGCGLSLLSQITPSVIKKLSSMLEPFPVRVKAIHLINPPKGMEVAFKMFMSVCHEKVRNRIFMHESFEELRRQKPDVCKALPKDYGGDNSSIDEIIANWKKDLFNNSHWFLEDEQYGITKTASETSNDTLFGAEGSFRSLNID